MEQKRKNDWGFAVFLMLSGLVLLLNTTGLVDWSVWTFIFKFWPLFIVFAGLNLIFESSKIFSFLVSFISIFLFILIITWSIAISSVDILKDRFDVTVPNWLINIDSKFSNIGNMKEETHEVLSSEYTNVEFRKYDLNVNTGDLKIENNSEDKHLYLETAYFEKWGKPRLEVKRNFNNLDISVKTENNIRTNFVDNQSPKYNFELGSSHIESDINIEFGAGNGLVELSNFKLNDYNVKLGAGDFTTNLSQLRGKDFNFEIGAGKMENSFTDIEVDNMKIDVGMGDYRLIVSRSIDVNELIEVSVGTGKVTIDFPDNVGYKIKYNLGIGSIKLGTKEISGFGNDIKEYESSNYDSSEYQVEIKANVGIGELIIK